MTLPPPEVCQQIFASWVLFGAPDWTEADRNRLFGLLAKHGLSINDLPQTFLAANVTAAPSRPKDKIYERLWRLFGQLGSDNQTIRTTARDQFECFPRLGVISPTSAFGKTTLLKLLDQLASETKLSKNATPAAIYRRLEHRPRTTYLVDEAENQGLLTDRVLRAVLDGGYERGGSIDRAGEEFLIFFPCAYALRGEMRDVPSSVLSRSHIVNMQLGTPKKLFERNDRAFSVARELIAKWRVTVALNLDPEMPSPLCNPRNPRLADNCRPLISVADTFGPPYGEAARAALIEFCASLPHSDAGVQVLQDIRTVPFDRISKKALAEALRELEIGIWDAWRGPNDQGKPHPLTRGELSRLLRRFLIRARTIWPIPRLPDSKSYSGYYRADFEQAWRDHCPPENDTSTHPSKIIALAKP